MFDNACTLWCYVTASWQHFTINYITVDDVAICTYRKYLTYFIKHSWIQSDMPNLAKIARSMTFFYVIYVAHTCAILTIL